MKWFALTLVVVCTWLVSCTFFKVSDPAPAPIPQPRPCDVEPLRVAVLDTGLGAYAYDTSTHLCKYGHRDFSKDKAYHGGIRTVSPMPVDFHGHGTNVVGLIEKYAGNTNYCIVVVKYYSTKADDFENMAAEYEALQYVAEKKYDFVNFSGGGRAFSLREYELVTEYLDGGGHLLAAAGNEHQDLGVHGFYPAVIDPRIIVVGALDKDGTHFKLSNYGDRVNIWEPGVDLSAYGISETGTSQATAIATGKLLAHIKNKCYKDTVGGDNAK